MSSVKELEKALAEATLQRELAESEALSVILRALGRLVVDQTRMENKIDELSGHIRRILPDGYSQKDLDEWVEQTHHKFHGMGEQDLKKTQKSGVDKTLSDIPSKND